MIRVLRDALKVGMYGMAERGQADFRPALKQRAAQFALKPNNGIGQ